MIENIATISLSNVSIDVILIVQDITYYTQNVINMQK
jgi:hypothetical protein